MSIRIDAAKCSGCGKCAEVCPGGLIAANGFAAIARPEDCWGCASCLKECGAGAIRLFLGADIGGNGATLFVKDDGETLRWIFTGADGNEKTISVSRSEANKY
jgi:adenylylsulfate reductase subunit B